MHAGMSYRRLAEHNGLQWPCYGEDHLGEHVMHWRLWENPLLGPRVPFIPTEYEPPVDQLDEEYPFMLTTGRRLEFFNTGVQTALYDSARPQEEVLEMNPEDAADLGIADGMPVRVSSRRGSVVLRARTDTGLYRGLLFMTLHFPDQVMTNFLTIHATDPKSGTAEFKATAARVEPVEAALEGVAELSERVPVSTYGPGTGETP
jgi:formate dehydrogenase major subunit